MRRVESRVVGDLGVAAALAREADRGAVPAFFPERDLVVAAVDAPIEGIVHRLAASFVEMPRRDGRRPQKRVLLRDVLRAERAVVNRDLIEPALELRSTGGIPPQSPRVTELPNAAREARGALLLSVEVERHLADARVRVRVQDRGEVVPAARLDETVARADRGLCADIQGSGGQMQATRLGDPERVLPVVAGTVGVVRRTARGRALEIHRLVVRATGEILDLEPARHALGAAGVGHPGAVRNGREALRAVVEERRSVEDIDRGFFAESDSRAVGPVVALTGGVEHRAHADLAESPVSHGRFEAHVPGVRVEEGALDLHGDGSLAQVTAIGTQVEALRANRREAHALGPLLPDVTRRAGDLDMSVARIDETRENQARTGKGIVGEGVADGGIRQTARLIELIAGLPVSFFFRIDLDDAIESSRDRACCGANAENSHRGSGFIDQLDRRAAPESSLAGDPCLCRRTERLCTCILVAAAVRDGVDLWGVEAHEIARGLQREGDRIDADFPARIVQMPQRERVIAERHPIELLDFSLSVILEGDKQILLHAQEDVGVPGDLARGIKRAGLFEVILSIRSVVSVCTRIALVGDLLKLVAHRQILGANPRAHVGLHQREALEGRLGSRTRGRHDAVSSRFRFHRDISLHGRERDIVQGVQIRAVLE